MDILVVTFGQVKAEVDMRPRILVEHLKPGQPADDIGSQAHRFFHKFSRARIANNAFLRERHHLDVNHIAPVLAQRKKALESSQLANAVHVGKGTKNRRAVEDALFDGPACPLQDVLVGVLCLVFPGEFETLTKRVVFIGAHFFLQEALVEMNMPADVGWHDQVSGSIHFCYRFISKLFSYCRYAISSDPEVPGTLVASQTCMANDQVHW